jgi:hypothetical protein
MTNNIYSRVTTCEVEKSDIIRALKQADDGLETVSMVCSVDLYDIFRAFDIDPVLVNAVKKSVASGSRGHKDTQTDLREAIAGLERALTIAETREYYGV